MKKITLLCLTILALSFTHTFAQDKIIFKSGEEKEGWIIEQSDKVIKYRLTDANNSPVVILKTNKVEKIVYRNGKEVSLRPVGIRMDKRLAINAGLMVELATEPNSFYQIQADYFIASGLHIVLKNFIETGGGGGFSLGAMHYFNTHRHKKFKAYAGLQGGALYDDFMLQIPVGVNFTTKIGFDIKLGLNGVYIPSYSGYNIYSELLIGWRF